MRENSKPRNIPVFFNTTSRRARVPEAALAAVCLGHLYALVHWLCYILLATSFQPTIGVLMNPMGRCSVSFPCLRRHSIRM